MATATAIKPTTTAVPIFQRIDLEKIFPDPDQPRQTFDEESLGELALSIKENDVVVPIKVRPHPKKGTGTFLLVAGERRWRASKLAGKTDIPAVIEVLDDTQALEQQIIENSQREDVPPIEEAEAYSSLMKDHGYTMERLIQKTGRSKAHLYGRLKLLGLAPGAKKALQSGKLAPAIAELIARLPDHKMQEQATKDVLGESRNDWRALDGTGAQPERIEDANHNRVAQPLSFRAAAQVIRRKYQTRLDSANFDTTDAKLTKAGACTACPHRSGNQPELPGVSTAKGEDYCSLPSCFEQKVQATFDLKAEAAKKAGLKVIEGAAAKKIMPYNGHISSDAPYVDPKAELPYDIAKPGSRATFASLLGKKAEDVPKVIVQDPNTGAAVELLDKGKAIEKLRELGKIDKASKTHRGSSDRNSADKKHREQRKKEKEKDALNELALRGLLEQVVAGATKDPGGKELAAWRWITACVIELVESNLEDVDIMASRRGLKHAGELGDFVEKAKTVGELRAVIVELFMCTHGAKKHGLWGYADKQTKELYDTGIKLFGGDWDKALAAAKKTSDAEEKVDAAKAAKKPAKAPAKKKGGGK